jgi:hypothetical protein
MVGDLPTSVMLTQDCTDSERGCVELESDQLSETFFTIEDALDETLQTGTTEFNAILGTAFFATDVQNNQLVIKSNVLTPGATYKFRLYANDRRSELGWEDESGTGYAQINIKVNAPPSPGKLTVTPANGFTLQTDFEIVCTEWLTKTYRSVTASSI